MMSSPPTTHHTYQKPPSACFVSTCTQAIVITVLVSCFYCCYHNLSRENSLYSSAFVSRRRTLQRLPERSQCSRRHASTSPPLLRQTPELYALLVLPLGHPGGERQTTGLFLVACESCPFSSSGAVCHRARSARLVESMSRTPPMVATFVVFLLLALMSPAFLSPLLWRCRQVHVLPLDCVPRIARCTVRIARCADGIVQQYVALMGGNIRLLLLSDSTIIEQQALTTVVRLCIYINYTIASETTRCTCIISISHYRINN